MGEQLSQSELQPGPGSRLDPGADFCTPIAENRHFQPPLGTWLVAQVRGRWGWRSSSIWHDAHSAPHGCRHLRACRARRVLALSGAGPRLRAHGLQELRQASRSRMAVVSISAETLARPWQRSRRVPTERCLRSVDTSGLDPFPAGRAIHTRRATSLAVQFESGPRRSGRWCRPAPECRGPVGSSQRRQCPCAPGRHGDPLCRVGRST